MPKWSRVQIEDYYYSLYLLLLNDARQNFSKIGRNLNINDKSAAKLYRWALAEKVLFPPFLRLNTFSNYLEYTYFMKFKNAHSIFNKIKDDPRVIHAAHCSGAFDLMVIANEKIDFSMENGFDRFILSGTRSDFLYNKVERKSMDTYYDESHKFLHGGNFIKSTITVPIREELVWDDLDLSIFRLLKGNLRMKYVDILRCFGLSKSVFYDHLYNVLGKCTVWTPYFPKGYLNYNEYFVLFKTEHESQLIEQLKRLPVHCPIFKVGEWIYAYVMIERGNLQYTFFDLLNLMLISGFVGEYQYSIPIYHWNKVWTNQDFPHHRSQYQKE
ncbi:MAG: hypothetical protein HXS41_04750 [Theionarchaea archaeon]|nr:hypothetical protein [Theionarchaea archaeon]